jgi:hypothetical protein
LTGAPMDEILLVEDNPGRRRADAAAHSGRANRQRGRRRAGRGRGARLSVRDRTSMRDGTTACCRSWSCSISNCRDSTGSRCSSASAPTRRPSCCPSSS